MLLTFNWVINVSSVKCSQRTGDPKAILAQGHCQVIKQPCYSNYDLRTFIYRCKHQSVLNEYCHTIPTTGAIRMRKDKKTSLNDLPPEDYNPVCRKGFPLLSSYLKAISCGSTQPCSLLCHPGS